jgi:hypothetical protein
MPPKLIVCFPVSTTLMNLFALRNPRICGSFASLGISQGAKPKTSQSSSIDFPTSTRVVHLESCDGFSVVA